MTGIIQAAAIFGLQSVLVKPKRSIGPFEAQVTIRESHNDELEITDHPVEQGARITDHAFKRAAQLVVTCGWSNSPSRPGLIGAFEGVVQGTIDGINSLLMGSGVDQVRRIYQNLLELQAGRVPFDVYTAKRVYTNMLLAGLRVDTDKETENSMIVTAQMREIIIVTTQTTTIAAPQENQRDAAVTSPVVDSGTRSLTPATTYLPSATTGRP